MTSGKGPKITQKTAESIQHATPSLFSFCFQNTLLPLNFFPGASNQISRREAQQGSGKFKPVSHHCLPVPVDLLVPAECSQTPGRRWLWAVTQSCRIFYSSSSFESHQPFLSPEFPATQDVILTDRRFVKCVCTSFFSKLLASSEKSHVEPPNGWEDVGFLELCVGIVSPILTSSVIKQVCVLLCDSVFKSLR